MHAIADDFPEVAEAVGQNLGVERARCFSGLSGYQKLIRSGVEAVALETPPFFFPQHVKQQSMPGCTFIWPSRSPSTCRDACKWTPQPRKRPNSSAVPGGLSDAHRPTQPRVCQPLPRGSFRTVGDSQEFLLRRAVRRSAANRHDSQPFAIAGLGERYVDRRQLSRQCVHPSDPGHDRGVGQDPVAAAGISRVARSDPHGDSHDMYGITYEFADGLLWTHTGPHSNGLTGPDDPLASCEFLGSAYMKIGYGGRALIRGGPKHYAGGSIDNLYAAGATRNIATFHKNVTEGNVSNETVRWPSTAV